MSPSTSRFVNLLTSARARSLTGALLFSLFASACGSGSGAAPSAAAPAAAAPVATTVPTFTDPPDPPKWTGGNPLKGMKFFVDPENNALKRAKFLAPTKPDVAKLLEERIGKQPTPVWIGDWNSNVLRKVEATIDLAEKQGQVAVFIAYNVPGRDCGQHSAGGVKTAATYRQWVRDIHAGIKGRPAVVVLEPDALGLLEKEGCLTKEQQQERLFLLRDAIKVLRQSPKTIVYPDGGHSKWHDVETHARLLKEGGVEMAHGFALNTSNYRAMDELLPFAKKLSQLLGGAHGIIDTSRNGAGPIGVEWCNPPNRKLGSYATTDTADPSYLDAYLWLKVPGESDGSCNGAPVAGAFWEKAAIELVTP
jgi:endoglucanase